MNTVRRRVVARGLVQGVYFRASCAEEARRRGVSGSVRNRPDGRSVEMVFEGDPDAVAALVEWAGRGPSHAVVDSVEVNEEAPEGEPGFRVV